MRARGRWLYSVDCLPALDCRRWRAGRIAKKNERDAAVEFWFGVPAKSLTEAEKIGRLANLNRLQAQETIHLQLYDSSNYRGVHDLYLAAYGRKDLADRAMSRAAERYADEAINANKIKT